MVVVYGPGTVIARMAHAHNRHGGPFELCPRCHGGLTWAPSEDRGVLVYRPGRPGVLVTKSRLLRMLLVR